jgi:aldose 1-epimerase
VSDATDSVNATDAPAPSGQQYVITSGDHEAVVVSVGGGVRGYTFGGRPILAAYPEQLIRPAMAGAVLTPWPNRLADGRYRFAGVDYQVPISEPGLRNAIHGLAQWMPWSLADREPSAVTMALDLPPQSGYPFSLRLSVRWSVGPGGLRAEHSAVNVGGSAAPFGLGAHPYLDIAGTPISDLRLQVPAATYLPSDDRELPLPAQPVQGSDRDLRAERALGDLRLNSPFTDLDRGDDGRAAVSVRTAAGGARVWVDPAFGYLQLYTTDRLMPGVGAIAVEPMTCPADAFNSGAGLVRLEPGQEWTGVWGVEPIAEPPR